MPWYQRRRRRWRRRRWPWYRRPRAPFRRRYWRRFWVRRRRKKLKRITVKEFQPQKINKLKVEGLYPLFLTTHDRLSNNLIQYIDSTTPHKSPGGGGFSIMQFNLQGLYELFLKSQNYWTKSNCNLPLIRFNGVTLRLYRAEKVDYIVTIQQCYPMCCSDIMYMSTQPAIMMMTKGAIKVTCRQNNPNKKPYKQIRVSPPSQMLTKWYFQSLLAKSGLLLIKATATSFDRWYTHSYASSTTIGFTSLNTTTFQYHNFKQYPTTTGYKPQDNLWLWGVTQGEQPDPLKSKVKQLIFLGNTADLQEGQTLEQNKTNLDVYLTDKKKWGNPFYPHFFTYNFDVFSTNKPPSEIIKIAKQDNNLEKTIQQAYPTTFVTRTIPLQTNCRYNPLADKGIGNKIFLVSIVSDQETWHEPKDPKLMRENLPLWLLTWGWGDWQKKLGQIHHFDYDYVTVIKSPYIEPTLNWYIPLDDSFTTWPPLSPYNTTLNQSDSQNWFPKNNFQVMSINQIASSGPGTVKLNKDQSCEAHALYKFHFKLGGCPAPMETICNPINEPVYPIPNNELQTPSLQSPTTPLETFLYKFDERRGQITAKAAKRLKTEYAPTEPFISTTGTTALEVPSYERPPEEDSSTSEEEKEEMQQQLLYLQRKQRKLRKRVLQLLDIQSL
nr:MAG: ORF1 [TTV-like mini virus]